MHRDERGQRDRRALPAEPAADRERHRHERDPEQRGRQPQRDLARPRHARPHPFEEVEERRVRLLRRRRGAAGRRGSRAPAARSAPRRATATASRGWAGAARPRARSARSGLAARAALCRVGRGVASRAMENDEVIFLAPGEGRSYQAGPMYAVFKADGAETGDAYCVSEWWLEAGDEGPHAAPARGQRGDLLRHRGDDELPRGRAVGRRPARVVPAHPRRHDARPSPTAAASGRAR